MQGPVIQDAPSLSLYQELVNWQLTQWFAETT
jgi:hypothetical protein